MNQSQHSILLISRGRAIIWNMMQYVNDKISSLGKPLYENYLCVYLIVKLQAKSLRLGVDFFSPLSQEQEEQEEE